MKVTASEVERVARLMYDEAIAYCNAHKKPRDFIIQATWERLDKQKQKQYLHVARKLIEDFWKGPFTRR